MPTSTHNPRPRRRSVLATVALVAVLTACSVAPADRATASDHDQPPLGFGPCQDEEVTAAGGECATVAVPLDHEHPGGVTIDVVISRIAARDSERRRGVMLFNPGGPGAPGLGYPMHLRSALGEVADRYDLIGFDPRFVGQSSPITCGRTRFSDTFRSAGQDRTGFRQSRDLAADFARRCQGRHADVLPYAGMPDSARDMDVVRAALGEARISYFGVSGGAHLGAVYSQLFPDRVDRMVLDSSYSGPSAELRERGPAAESALDEWARWTAARHELYGLGATGSAVRGAVDRLVGHAARRPITVDVGGGVHHLDDHTLPLLLQRWLNHEDDNASLAGAVRDLVDAADGRPVTPSAELVERLAFFDAHDPMLDNGLAAAWANLCNDDSWPSGARPYWRAIQRSRRALPLFGPLVNNVTPCAFWPDTSTRPPVPIGNAVPVLMVQAERDNNTLLASAQRLHGRLTGSRLITADVRAHGVYGRAAEGYTPVPCIDRVVNDYLGGGALPDHDLSCG